MVIGVLFGYALFSVVLCDYVMIRVVLVYVVVGVLLYIYVVWSSGTATMQAIWCHDISVAWVRIPSREEQNNCESKFIVLTLLG